MKMIYNLKYNEFDNVKNRKNRKKGKKGAYDSQGTATFHTDGQQHGSLSQKRSRSSNNSVEVPVTTLDDEVGDAHVFLMKLDLQGSELDALRAVLWLRSVKARGTGGYTGVRGDRR